MLMVYFVQVYLQDEERLERRERIQLAAEEGSQSDGAKYRRRAAALGPIGFEDGREAREASEKVRKGMGIGGTHVRKNYSSGSLVWFCSFHVIFSLEAFLTETIKLGTMSTPYLSTRSFLSRPRR